MARSIFFEVRWLGDDYWNVGTGCWRNHLAILYRISVITLSTALVIIGPRLADLRRHVLVHCHWGGPDPPTWQRWLAVARSKWRD